MVLPRKDVIFYGPENNPLISGAASRGGPFVVLVTEAAMITDTPHNEINS